MTHLVLGQSGGGNLRFAWQVRLSKEALPQGCKPVAEMGSWEGTMLLSGCLGMCAGCARRQPNAGVLQHALSARQHDCLQRGRRRPSIADALSSILPPLLGTCAGAEVAKCWAHDSKPREILAGHLLR